MPHPGLPPRRAGGRHLPPRRHRLPKDHDIPIYWQVEDMARRMARRVMLERFDQLVHHVEEWNLKMDGDWPAPRALVALYTAYGGRTPVHTGAELHDALMDLQERFHRPEVTRDGFPLLRVHRRSAHG